MSNSPWQPQPIIDHIQQEIATLCQADALEDCALMLDESGDKQTAQATIGVSRQSLGRLGKVEVCHKGVYLAYTSPSVTQMVEGELYLPEDGLTPAFPEKGEPKKLP